MSGSHPGQAFHESRHAGLHPHEDQLVGQDAQGNGRIELQKSSQLYQQAGQYLHDQAFGIFLWQPFTLGAAKSDISFWRPYPIADEWVRLQRG